MSSWVGVYEKTDFMQGMSDIGKLIPLAGGWRKGGRKGI